MGTICRILDIELKILPRSLCFCFVMVVSHLCIVVFSDTIKSCLRILGMQKMLSWEKMAITLMVALLRRMYKSPISALNNARTQLLNKQRMSSQVLQFLQVTSSLLTLFHFHLSLSPCN
ncbi:uncharacterized protein LOC142522916 [Primulina tabacum]|uniref:uncharacterized protein LOC142522916 n=1 Tax=Primulina tabacum TaxID=48773 RepID=UPI003F5A40D3